MDHPAHLPGHTILPEPLLVFGQNHTDTHPLRGLNQFGPYSADLKLPSSVRLAYFAPANQLDKLARLAAELLDAALPVEALNYYPAYPGFSQAFKTELVTPNPELMIGASESCQRLASSKNGEGLAMELVGSLAQLIRIRTSFDVLLLYLPSSWSDAFEYEGFSLHDSIKSKLAPLNIPIQIVNDATWMRKCRAQVMWGLSVAIYAKSGGIPWKLADADTSEAHIGLSYAIKNVGGGNEYTTCCSQLFDPDGTGFEFVAFDTREFTTDIKGNPYLSYSEMQAVLSKTLLIFQNGHRGRTPKKVFVHKSSPFTSEEIEGAIDAFGSGTEIELVQIVKSTGWVGIKWNKFANGPLKSDAYPIDRGTYLPISKNECLLWTQGSVKGINQQKATQPVFKEAPLKPLPSPILLRRFAGAGGWHDTCRSILGLTKVDWNNNTLYKTLPVTLGYSAKFANVVKHSPSITNSIYDYRFFM